MTEITVLYDGTLYTYQWIKTLFWARKEFKEKGYSINYVNYRAYFPISSVASKQVDDMFKRGKTDILLLAFHHSTANITDVTGQNIGDLLYRLKEKCNILVWLDTADSTGSPNFEVLPFVDVYLKKQMLKDKSLYHKKIYGSRLYVDYYHKKTGIEDTLVDVDYTLLLKEYDKKVRLSWNIGLSDFWTKGIYSIFRPYRIKHPITTSVNKNRTKDIFFNGHLDYTTLVGLQRRKTCELIEADTVRKHISPTETITHKQYIEAMKDTHAAISPFGWGEICYRDFEAFVYGATLIKPDSEHFITYPNFFQKGYTYVSLDWDFDNYESVASKSSSQEYKQIAANAQELFIMHTQTVWGKRDFVNHCINQITI